MPDQPAAVAVPWSREEFSRRLGGRAVIGMVHLKPLPGSPLYGGSMRAVIDAAMADALAIAGGGAAALLIENFGDRPFSKTAGAETVAAMTLVVAEIRREVTLPFGINVLRNDPRSALAIAAATGAAFIRVNVHTGAMVTDQGIIEGEADRTLRLRQGLSAASGIFADHLVKHAAPLAPLDPLQSAKDLRSRGLADVLVVTGRATGVPADLDSLRMLREALDGVPLVAGSGATSETARDLRELADGIIAGTSIKRDGEVDQPVERERVARIVDAFA